MKSLQGHFEIKERIEAIEKHAKCTARCQEQINKIYTLLVVRIDIELEQAAALEVTKCSNFIQKNKIAFRCSVCDLHYTSMFKYNKDDKKFDVKVSNEICYSLFDKCLDSYKLKASIHENIYSNLLSQRFLEDFIEGK